MTYITSCVGQFPYFDTILGHPVWQGKTVLDFGGNNGNLLSHPESTIDHDKYWCIDASKDAIDEGQRRYPKAKFLFHDCYSFGFNPGGIKDLPLPKIEQKFDYILSVSTLGTNVLKAEMLELIVNLNRWLKNGGVLAFTFVHPHHIPEDAAVTNLQHYAQVYGGEQMIERLAEDKKHSSWYAVTSNKIYVESDLPDEDDEDDKERENNDLLILYTPEYMQLLFPHAEVAAPVRPLTRSHCCILRNGGKGTRVLS